MKQRRIPRKYEQGSSLVAVMGFMALLIVTIASITSIVNQKKKESNRSKFIDSRNFALTSALRNARVSTYYYKTIVTAVPAPDPIFVNCMIGDGVTALCNTGGPHPLALLDDVGVPIMGGSAASSVMYDIYGQVCTTPSSNLCLYEAWATYTASCAATGSPCLQAEIITVTVSLRPIASVYPADYPPLAIITADEVVPISNYFDYYGAAFPPISYVSGIPPAFGISPCKGAPISGNAGPPGSYRWYVSPFDATASGYCAGSFRCSPGCPACVYFGAVGGGGGGGAAAPPGTIAACGPGTQIVNGVCTSFNF